MIKLIQFVVSAGLAIIVAAVHPALAEKRVALVIGNSNYAHVGKLANPGNDAQDMSKALRELGFDVVTGIDLDKRGMSKTIRTFSKKLTDADVALFFYAGHGLQVNGQNYLAPVNARLKDEADLDFDMVPLNLVLRQMRRTQRVNMVFLDACRDNPLLKELGRSMGATRSASLTRGLARVETVVGTMISYATAPDQVALDGTGRNSPFTTALLKHIATPGMDVGNMMIKVRKDVLKSSKGKQVPWDHSSLTGQFFFKPAKKAPPVAQKPSTQQQIVLAPPPTPQVHETTFELTFWNSVKNATDPSMFESYLIQYPKGVFAPIARAKIAALKRAAERKPQPKPPVKEPNVETSRLIGRPPKQPDLAAPERIPTCKVATWNRNACSALYVGRGNAWGGAWGNNKKEALRKARRECSKYASDCKLRKWVCNGRSNTNKFAAIAFSTQTGGSGWAYNYNSRATAERIAMQKCNEQE